MKNKKRTTIAAITLSLIGAVVAVAYIADRRTVVADPVKQPAPAQTMSERPGSKPRLRNLSLQPEALAVARRLGTRFGHGNRAQSTVVGTLTIGTETRMVRTVRTQTDDGEQIEINLAGRGGVLTWDGTRGAFSGASRALGADRDLIERLVFDSPDQFVLAQLRGASYFTVARNVRPVDAGDNYAGPLWNIVRVNDPEPDETKRPQSFWRLYYVNTATGLIDRIESEVEGQRIVAVISGWTEHSGEKVPTQITWTRQGQTLLQYSLTNFSHAEK